eukprot:g3952.t1
MSSQPPSMRGQNIMAYELIAILLAYRLFRSRMLQTHVIAHCDNAGAVFSLVKGQSKNAYATGATFAINDWTTQEIPESYVFYAYISTNWNAADACTRKEYVKDLRRLVDPDLSVPREVILAELQIIANDIDTAVKDFNL